MPGACLFIQKVKIVMYFFSNTNSKCISQRVKLMEYIQRWQVLKMHHIRDKITKSVCINATSLCSYSEPNWMLPHAGCQRLSIKNELCIKKQNKTQKATILLWGVSGERIDFPPWLSGWFFFSLTDLFGGSTTMARGCDMFPSSRVLRVWEALSSLAMLMVFR